MNPEESRKEFRKKYGFRSLLPGREELRRYKWAGMVLVLCFLAAGGGVAWVAMRNAAFRLSGAASYPWPSADGSYSGFGARSGAGPGAGAEESVDGEAASAAAGAPVLKTALSSIPGSGGSVSGAAAPVQRGFSVKRGKKYAQGYPDPSGSGVSGSVDGFPAGGSADRLKGAAAARNAGGSARAGGGAASARVVNSGANRSSGAAGGARNSVMEALRSAFKANIYGARLASQDAARMWTSKTFDATRDSSLSLEYSENLKAKLDRVNPDSIPDYLRAQNLDATNARSLGVSKVGDPFLDREGTKEALREDKDYQRDKLTRDFMAAVFDPLGPFGGVGAKFNPSSGGSSFRTSGPSELRTTAPEERSGPELPIPEEKSAGAASGRGGGSSFSDPETERELKEIVQEDLVDSGDFGGECGCTAENPCCCLPAGYLDRKNPPGQGAAGDFPAQPAVPAGK